MQSWSPALAEPEPRTIALTVEEWCALPEDAPGEFVDGYLTQEEVPDPIHGLAVTWLIALFRAWLGPGQGFVFDSDTKCIVRAGRGRKPDVSVYFRTVRGCQGLALDLYSEIREPQAAI